jgi:hypothetical protein
MAKKNQKQQLKQPNAATTTCDKATVTVPVTSEAITSPPANTRLTFFNYITVASTEEITEFLELAATKSESENLRYLWERAYEDGYENGRKSLLRNLGKNLQDKFEDGVERGMDLGREEGYTVAKEGFDRLLEQIKAREDSKIRSTSNSGTQTSSTTFEIIKTRTNLSVSTQTDSLATPITSSPLPTPATLPQSSPAQPQSTLTTSLTAVTTTASTQLPTPRNRQRTLPDHTTSSHTGPHSLVTHSATLQSPALLAKGENTDLSTTKATSTGEISQNLAIFSSPMPSVNVSNLITPSTTITALETRSTMASFIENHQKLEKSVIFNQVTTKSPSPDAVGHTNDPTEDCASPATHNDLILQPPPPFPSASSSQSSAAASSILHEKSVPLSAVFESQAPTVSTAPTSIVTALKTRSKLFDFVINHQKTEMSPIFTQKAMDPIVSDNSKRTNDVDTPPALATIIPASETPSATAGFMKNHQNIENSPVFSQKILEPLVTKHFSWADDTYVSHTTPISPMKSPRDLSCLRSTTPHPFSSLRRRHGHPKNRRSFQRHGCHNHFHSHSRYYQHYPSPYSQPPPAIMTNSLDWDQDPRLLDLSNALRALGWVRR